LQTTQPATTVKNEII